MREPCDPNTMLLRYLCLGTLALYWLVIFLGTHAPGGVSGLKVVNDKLLHFIAYLGLAFLLAAALTSLRVKHGTLLLPLIVAIVYGGIDEYTQGFVPGRHPDLADWFADVMGAGVGVLLFSAVNFARRRYTVSMKD